LAQLPEDQRRAVEMRLIAGLSVQETAQKMNKTEAAIKMLQQRALANLRKIFQDNKPTVLGGDADDERTISNRRNLKGY